MKVITYPQSGKCGPVVYENTKFGIVVRQKVVGRNPRTKLQMDNRRGFGSAAKQWHLLTDDQRDQWCARAASQYKVTAAGIRVPLSGYSYFVSINSRQANLGLPFFDLPPPPPVFSPNPVGELVATNTGGNIGVKLHVPAPPGEHTMVQIGVATSSGVRCFPHHSRVQCGWGRDSSA